MRRQTTSSSRVSRRDTSSGISRRTHWPNAVPAWSRSGRSGWRRSGGSTRAPGRCRGGSPQRPCWRRSIRRRTSPRWRRNSGPRTNASASVCWRSGPGTLRSGLGTAPTAASRAARGRSEARSSSGSRRRRARDIQHWCASRADAAPWRRRARTRCTWARRRRTCRTRWPFTAASGGAGHADATELSSCAGWRNLAPGSPATRESTTSGGWPEENRRRQRCNGRRWTPSAPTRRCPRWRQPCAASAGSRRGA